MNNDIWLGFFRHILTMAGGIFVAKGYVDADTLNTAIGATTALAGFALSIADKKGR
jgi:hypothetical protein